MSNPELPASLFCAPMLLGSCAGISSYPPSLDVYGSYFPAWLICLMAGVVLTIFVSLIGRVFDLGTVRILGPLVPIGLILIFSITTWFLFFAA
jgi:hypothetical protein